jgi:hypothetical protein
VVAEKLCGGCEGTFPTVHVECALNEWKGCRRYYSVRDCRRCGRAGENHRGLGRHFTRHHVPLVFWSYRDGLRLHGEFGDETRRDRLDLCRSNQVQHSRRHEDMQFMILTDEELVKFSDFLTIPGTTAQFMWGDQQTKERGRNACFACKHCILNPRKPSALWGEALF